MRERFIFNFRVPPEDIAPHLPQWIEPQVINGYRVVSFCVLVLDRLSLWPIPPIFNIKTISCACRIGVVDWSSGEPEPAVYGTDRYADRPRITRISPFILHDTIPTIHTAIGGNKGSINLVMSHRDGRALFSSNVAAAPSLEFALSMFSGTLAKVDLYKDEVEYLPIRAEIEFSALVGDWPDAHLGFDCAVVARTPDGKESSYKSAFRGLWGEK